MDDQRSADFGSGEPRATGSGRRETENWAARPAAPERRERTRPVFVAPTAAAGATDAVEHDTARDRAVPDGMIRDGDVPASAPAHAGPEGDDGTLRTPPDERVSWPGAAPPTTAPPRRRRLVPWLILFVVVIGVIVWLVLRTGAPPARQGRYQSTAAMPVGTATVSQGDMPITLSGLGTVTPLATVTVKTQINGQLISVGFKEGQHVKKGDFLAQIDPRPYQVALEQAQGQLAKDQAALANAERDLTRYRTLVAQNSIARQTLDTQIATVDQDKATIQADQAQVDAQKLNLTYCHIVSPVTGRVGLRQVDPGNYVQTSDASGLVIVAQLQPISVIFTLPEDNLPEVLKQVHAGVSLQATAFDRSGATKLATGTLDTIDNEIDTSTGTVKLRATFNNESEILFPNQFVNIQLLVDTLKNVDIVPVSAIERGAPGTFVYVVKPDKTVAVQVVKLGPADGQRQAVLSGLQPGEAVVTDGADRLKDGAKVNVVQPQQAGAASKPPAGQSAASKPPAGQSAAGQSAPGQSTPGQSAPGQSAPGQSAPGQSAPGQSAPGQSAAGQSAPGQSAADGKVSGEKPVSEPTKAPHHGRHHQGGGG